MKKREWLIVFIPVLLTWWIDRLTKDWASEMDGVGSVGLIKFILHHNHGAMLGLFSELPNVLRTVSLATGGAFLLCSYLLIQYLLPVKSLTLRVGLSFLIGGILGNVTDRIIWGHVVDFIVITFKNTSSPAFNLADAIQWIGYGMIVFAIIKEGDKLWPELNTRKKSWVHFDFQFKYSMILASFGFGLVIISAVFSYTYLRITISDLVGQNSPLINRFLIPYLITYSLIGLGFCIFMFTIGKIISHNIAGPLYAFQRFLKDLMNGKQATLRLRTKDEFKELQDFAIEIKKHYGKSKAISQNETSTKIIDIPMHELPKVQVQLEDLKTPSQAA